MSETFVLAAHLPIPKPELAKFLKLRPAGKDLVRRASSMFQGWGWDGKKSAWKRSASVVSNGALLSGLALEVARGESPVTLVFAHDRRRDGFDFYFTLAGFAPETLQPLLLMLASAGKSFRKGTDAHAVLLAETSGRLRAKAVLSVVSISAKGAAFVGPNDVELAPLLRRLKPAEKRFVKALGTGNPAETLDSDAVLVPELRSSLPANKLVRTGDLASDLLALDADEKWWGQSFNAAQKQLIRRARRESAAAAPGLLDIVRSGKWGSAVTAVRCLVALSSELGDPSLAIAAVGAMHDWSDETAQHGCSGALLKEVPAALGPKGAELLADAIEARLRTSARFDKWAFIFLLNHAGAPEQLTRLSAGGKKPRRFTAAEVNHYRLAADVRVWQSWIFEGVTPNL